MGKLDGKIAVVTGGSAGMGFATAKLFVEEGATVIITGRDQAALDAAVLNIGRNVEALRSDIARMADIEALRAHVETRYGRVDILFANAGTGKPQPFERTTEEEFDLVVDTNFKGTFFTVQKLAPLMTTGGSVVLNGSMQSIKGFPGFAVYAATKAAIRSLARTMTAELAAKGIRVNAIAPGVIDTDLIRKVGLSEEQIAAFNQQAHAQIPLARSGSAEEVAKVVLFLASDEASYVSGVELTIDGGWTQV
ncbi:glucose 1-dehydrogenase [Mesorhizobium sp. RMAD-H1]|uniref:glucose 1-dehydrogenase n=1 Tax=Mesorhizobium sp. RMAD-H1 TaxID=2587065 RepID=UPI00160842B7|nr:glucose 1-dehydrogenase [Mesorhizobium sp. RMAD-H1]MBB2973453.1 NAD(P)-dependent dehydrogenase (short-subunit alcohol dehydrogenase family) [Mesorhizobium sp. RMAD-H1]